MIHFSSLDFDSLVAGFFFPLARILAFFAVAPLFSNVALPRRIRLILGLVVTFALMPLAAVPPGLVPASGAGLLILAQQVLIGIAMGLVFQVTMASIALAGELISMQMGLGFSTMYDPTNAAQTTVIAEVITLLTTLVFLSMNGHLILMATLAESFSVLPIGGSPPGLAFHNAENWRVVAEWGAHLFYVGLLLSLPVVVALTIINMALAILARAAPQLNLMAVGFPFTLGGGMLFIGVSLSYLEVPLTRMFDEGIRQMLNVLR